MGGFLIINPRSGNGNPDADELRAEAERRGIATHVLREDDDPAGLAREAEPPLGVAGGDGSLAAVAEVALERGVPFVVVPYGTRNHFARDLGLDRDDPVAALDAFAGRERRVDVGRANDVLFLNNVSLGLYAGLVHRREGHRRRRQLFARLRALGMLARRPRPLGITIDSRPVEARVVLVANNAYRLELFSIGERERLHEGLLHLYVAHGWLPTSWDDEAGERFTIDAAGGRLRAAVDGEPEELETPLRFEIRPRALRVLLPQE
jgi:diacylglycerol kinase family enzyme